MVTFPHRRQQGANEEMEMFKRPATSPFSYSDTDLRELARLDERLLADIGIPDHVRQTVLVRHRMPFPSWLPAGLGRRKS